MNAGDTVGCGVVDLSPAFPSSVRPWKSTLLSVSVSAFAVVNNENTHHIGTRIIAVTIKSLVKTLVVSSLVTSSQ